MAAGVVGAMLGVLVLAAGAAAQPQALAPQDTARTTGVQDVSSAPVPPDTLRESFRNRVSRLISDQIFAAPGRLVDNGTAQPADVPFRPYRGRVIRDVRVVRVGVFEYYDGVAARSKESAAGRIGDLLHFDSRVATIRKYLLMKPGDRLDSETLADTERLLRQTPFVLDARIDVVPVANEPDSVDVLVITRDSWSLGFDPRVKTSRRYDFNIQERNVAGLGHQLRFDFDVDLDLDQTVGYTGTYRSDNLQGTFIRGEYRYRDTNAEGSHRVQFARNRLSPQIRSIGALEVETAKLFPQVEGDSLRSLRRGDIWAGRAFPLGRSPLGGTSRAAITPALRVLRIDYRDRPVVTPSQNRPFRDRTLWLGSLSLNRSRFRESRLIRGYGRTEDIPYGFLLTATAGSELDEFENRPYFDIKARAATYSEGIGYAFAGAALGGHRQNDEWEDTVLDLETSYFSQLGSLWRFKFRHFLDVRYTRGTLRRDPGTLRLDRNQGLIAVDGNDQRGDQRLVATLESVTFVPFQLLGFKFALFEFISTGTLGPDHGSFLEGRYTTTAGFGLRFHNERLIFNPFELRFAFLLAGPDGTTINSYRFGTSAAADLTGLEPGAPSKLPFE